MYIYIYIYFVYGIITELYGNVNGAVPDKAINPKSSSLEIDLKWIDFNLSLKII